MPRHLIQLRPRREQDYIGHSHSILICGPDGFIKPNAKQGLFVFQTRSLAQLRYLLNGKPFEPVALSPVQHHSWLGYYIARPPGNKKSTTQETVELRVSRFVGNGLHEEIELVNYSQSAAKFQFAIEIGADFADQSEAGSKKRQARGSTTVEWRDEPPELVFRFDAEHAYDCQGETGVARVHQELAIRIRHARSSPSYSSGRILFTIDLSPKESWHACIDFIPTLDQKTLEPLYGCGAFEKLSREIVEQERFLTEEAATFTVAHVRTLAADASITIQQASEDVAALRLHDLDTAGGWVAAAGWPEFVALFGRDSLATAWEASLLSANLLRGTLPALAALQGKSDNPWRDEHPGKIPHQASNGIASMLNYNPFQRYYGSITSSAVFPFALATLWQQTGDTESVRRFIDPALDAIRCRDEYGDLDGDGFGEYLCRSRKGLKNQGWKDSGDAIVYEDGSQVSPPIATAEEQGFLYIAKLRMAELLWWLGRTDEAKCLFRAASELKKRFNEAFWMQDLGYFALGLDAKKRQIRSIASNPGHLLATAIVDSSLARATADRLMAEDLFSGWGVRTLSTCNPAYDPFAYQRGCVWPAENGMFALGFLRYGLHDHVERITRAQFEAAALFEHHRLPEAFGGHPRDGRHPFPAAYPQANWPQAWSSAAVYLYIAALLGIFPYAPLKLLFVDPHLPDWLPEMRMSNFHVGDAIVAIRFYRKENGESDYEVTDLDKTLHVVRQPSPWSLTATAGERFLDVLKSFLPARSG